MSKLLLQIKNGPDTLFYVLFCYWVDRMKIKVSVSHSKEVCIVLLSAGLAF